MSPRLRLFAVLALSGLAGFLGVLGIILPIHEYDWADEPQMQELVDPDVVLTVIVLCLIGLITASVSILLARRLEGGRALRWIVLGAAGLALALCTFRLVEVLPLYTG